MKKLTIIIFLLSSFVAGAQAPVFSVDAGLALDNYGYISDGDGCFSTAYGGAAVAADWLWPSHAGLRIGLGNGWALSSNATDTWEKPLHQICNVALSVTPYYEFAAGRWAFDIGALAGCRARLPFLNTDLSSYVATVSVGLGADVRAKFRVADKLQLFAAASAQRTVFDYLYRVYYTFEDYPVSGNCSITLGVCRTF